MLARVSERVDAARPMVDVLTQTQVSDEQLAAVKVMVVARVSESVPELQPEIEAYLEEQLQVGELVESS